MESSSPYPRSRVDREPQKADIPEQGAGICGTSQGTDKIGMSHAQRADEEVDPAYAEYVKRELAEAEEEAQRGEGISLDEFERNVEALMDEIRTDVRAGRAKP